VKKQFVIAGAIAAAISLALLFTGTVQAQHTGHSDHRFSDAHKWAQVFDDPTRDAWQKPDEVIAALKLAPYATAADIGAGTGYFSARLARTLSGGKVYAIDLEPDMVKYLGERATKEKLANLIPLQGAADQPKIPAAVDLILLVDVYHHISNRESYFRKVRETLKAGGQLAIIDFRMDATMGPSKAMRIAPERVKSELASAGFSLTGNHEFLPQQYFLVFKPASK